MTDVEYLPTIPENTEYLWNAETRTSRLFRPFKLHNNEFEQAIDHKKRCRIDLPGLPQLIDSWGLSGGIHGMSFRAIMVPTLELDRTELIYN